MRQKTAHGLRWFFWGVFWVFKWLKRAHGRGDCDCFFWGVFLGFLVFLRVFFLGGARL